MLQDIQFKVQCHPTFETVSRGHAYVQVPDVHERIQMDRLAAQTHENTQKRK
jgi:hypothetical protein